MEKPKERRMHLRVYRNFILSYHEKGKTAQTQEVTQVNNVSQGGINFSSTHPLNKGDVMAIELKTPFLADAVHLEGVVLDCKEKIADMIYEIRVQFKEVPQKSLAVLEKIENYSKADET